MNPSYELFRYHSAQSPVALVRVELTGADATTFLQGQSTNTVDDLKMGQLRLQAFTDRVGKWESYFWAARENGRWSLFVPVALASALRVRFERFVISEDAELGVPREETWWIALGPKAPAGEFEGQLGGERATWAREKWPNLKEVSAQCRDDFLAWQGEPPFAPTESPQLINQSRLFAAVDLRKGCFPGQETVAKVQYNRSAAWAPALLHSPSGIFPANLELEGKAVARGLAPEGEWSHAELLRDVRVEGLKLTVNNQQYTVKLYPRFATLPATKAQEAYHLGTEAFARGDEAQAMRAWESAVALDAGYADAHEAMGVLLGRQGQLDEAIARMRLLLEVDPASVMAHTNLSLFLMRQGHIEEAEKHKSLATVASFQRFGAEAKAKRDSEEARARVVRELAERESMFRQVLEIDPEDTLANFGMADILHERGDHTAARENLRRVLLADPRYSVAYLLLGKVLIALSLRDEARGILEEGIRIAAQRGDLMPANEMQGLRLTLG